MRITEYFSLCDGKTYYAGFTYNKNSFPYLIYSPEFKVKVKDMDWATWRQLHHEAWDKAEEFGFVTKGPERQLTKTYYAMKKLLD